MTASAASSAAVTGDWSGFSRRSTSVPGVTIVAAAARATIAVRSSMRRSAISGVTSGATMSFAVIAVRFVLGARGGRGVWP